MPTALQVTPLPAHALLILLLQMALILSVSRLLGEVFRRLGQPSVIGELLSGIVLGPSLFGWLLPGAYEALFPAVALQAHLLEVVAWLGMILLMMLTGFETDIRLLRQLGRAALWASVLGMLVPFATGFAFAEWLPATALVDPARRHLFAAFFATAMAISAMPVLAKILFDLELTRRDIGVVILSAGVVDDTVGWLILSVIAGLASAGGFDGWQFGRTVLLTAGFVAISARLALPAVRWLFRVVDDRFRSRNADLTLIVVLTFLAAAATEWIGVHAVFGAFVAGCLLRQAPRVRPATVHRLEAVALSVFAPIFFGVVGLKVDLRALERPWVLLAVLGVATAGKLIGCTAGGLIGGLRFWESLSIGAGMNARGAMELVVAMIGLRLGLLTPEMYAVIVAVAIITSFMAPISLRFTVARLRMSETERSRLLAATRRQFIDPSTLKALLPTAGGRNALAAAGIASALARGAQATVTALYIDQAPPSLWRRLAGHFRPPDQAGQNLQQHLDALRMIADRRKTRIDVERLSGVDTAALIQREANARGSDLLLIGAGSRPREALRGDLLQALVGDLHCHLAIVHAPEAAGERRWAFERVLVPYDGSYFSQVAVELAVMYAEGAGATVTVLYVVDGEEGPLDGESDGELGQNFRRMMATTLMATMSPAIARSSAPVRVVVAESTLLTPPVFAELATARHDLLIVGAESRALRQRLLVGYDIEKLVELAPCAVAVLVPRLGTKGGEG